MPVKFDSKTEAKAGGVGSVDRSAAVDTACALPKNKAKHAILTSDDRIALMFTGDWRKGEPWAKLNWTDSVECRESRPPPPRAAEGDERTWGELLRTHSSDPKELVNLPT